MSHGIYNTRFLFGMDEAAERAFYEENIALLRRHMGTQLKGILTPAISNTVRTPRLIAEAGLLYHADWVHDDVPVPILVEGQRLISVPYTYELNDAPLWDGRPYGGRYFVEACKAAFDRLYTESADGGRVFCIALHPYQIGQPHHIGHLREILDHICTHDGVWHATGDDIAEHFLRHHYDRQLAHAIALDEAAKTVAARRSRVVIHARPANPVPGGPTAARQTFGMDQPHHGWSPLPARKPFRWPDRRTLAVVPLVILEVYEDPLPAGWPQIHSVGGGLVRDFPNISRVSTREYGHRVGVFRLLDALKRRGVRPTVAIDAMTAELYPALVDELRSVDAEFVAHGISVTRPIHSGMSSAEEGDYIATTLARLAACGIRPRGWFGPEYAESTLTPQLLGGAGIEWLSDWASDEQPFRMTTPGELVALPLWADFDDQTVLINRMCDLAMFENHFLKAINQLAMDGATTARVLHYAVRPWISGAPLRIGMFERVLDHALAQPGIWMPTGSEVIEAWKAANA
jgi:peptidoglycan/xylan/chitin deacetylase (PgdA/CDA1 family)